MEKILVTVVMLGIVMMLLAKTVLPSIKGAQESGERGLSQQKRAELMSAGAVEGESIYYQAKQFVSQGKGGDAILFVKETIAGANVVSDPSDGVAYFENAASGASRRTSLYTKDTGALSNGETTYTYTLIDLTE